MEDELAAKLAAAVNARPAASDKVVVLPRRK